MEIIIRTEEKENPTVGEALRGMKSDYWVKTYLPQIVQTAKEGGTQTVISFCSHENTARLVGESFSKLGIKVTPKDIYNTSYGRHYKQIVFSWD